MLMCDVTGPSFTRFPSWKRVIERNNASTETENLQYTESGNNPMEPLNISTQTETESSAEYGDINISQNTVSLIEEALEEGEKSKKLFDRLLSFHIRDIARLQLARTVPVTVIPAEGLPIRSIVVGANGRIALLLAATQHESWCNHNAHVLVCHWNKQFALPQAVCPTAAAWGIQGRLVVANHSGHVILYHGQQLVTSTQVHEGPVTALDWKGKEIISCGTDGFIHLLSIRGATLEKEKSVRLSVADLPRQIRRGAPSSRPIGVVSIARFEKELIVASETGGVWRLSLLDFTLVPAVATPLAIQQLLLLPSGRMIVNDVDNRIVILSSEETSESASMVCLATWMFTMGTLLITSDEETINIIETQSMKQLFTGHMKSQAISSFGNDEIVILNEHNELQIYNILF